MGARKPFKVVIVGGGVAGLTLANMLQKFDIDFVVLESHGEVAPAVGASVGLLPNGLRILDQIGCFEPILAMRQESLLYANLRDTSGKKRRDQSSIFGDGQSALVLSGPENRVYWFIFVRLPEVKHGRSIPKYTKEDDEAFAKEYADVYVNDEIKFRDIYKKKINSTLTPLHEMVYKTWFYRRVILLGDSAHKGGNGAMESAAELINALIQARDTHHGLENLQEEDFLRIFARVQSVRNKRAQSLVESSHQRQALMASENRLKTALATTMMTLVPAANLFLPNSSAPLVGSSKINRLPVPFRPRAIPFEDERPAVPVKPETSKTIRQIYAGAMLASSILAAVTTPACPASDLWQHVAPILMYTIEGHRAGNGSPILATPSVMAIGLHRLGINRVIPSYALLHLSRGGKSKRRPDAEETDESLDRYKTHDMPYLRATYLCAFTVQAVAHVASGAPFLTSQTLLGALTDAVTSPSAFLGSLASLSSGASLACGVWVLQNLYAIWDMRRAGYIKTFSALKAAVGVALGQVLVGPGATWAGLWYWRDEVFAGSMIK
ncbi:putative FAD binding domain-containing protein [Colletotrichum sublineola]|uniref:Putative FAD binding domain-containing protein n=1 Tax=Colletotrichum sublineola TaxID=1173701 RepID=A0A066XJK9_COLSU|nr:putative FAD binding domain-containing protein [Colletotrichum sublineola]